LEEGKQCCTNAINILNIENVRIQSHHEYLDRGLAKQVVKELEEKK